MDDWTINFTANVAAGLVGAAAGYLLQGRSDPSAGISIKGDGNTVVQNNKQTAKSKTKIVINWETVVQGQPPRRRSQVPERSTKTNDFDQFVLVFFGAGFAAVAIAVGYLAVRSAALLALGVASVFLLCFTLASLGYAIRNYAKLDRTVLARLAICVFALIVVVIDIYNLSNPVFPSDRLRLFFESGRSVGVKSILDYLPFQDVVFLSFQALGLLLLAMALLVVLVENAGILARLQKQVRNSDPDRPHRIAQKIPISSPGWTFLVVFISLLSIPLSNGWLFSYFDKSVVITADESSAFSLEGNAKRSPTTHQASLLCASLSRNGNPVGAQSVLLQVRDRGRRVPSAWRSIGGEHALASNGTACVTVLPRRQSGPYRFTLAGKHAPPVRSDTIPLQN
jgi:hypothetical protein